ncbi:MAG TPA: bifunctional DNA-formamidopyrimidine glycosylase/DNA-(apurinic or apyrimidinic site) lyase [Pyrinomonadaceae bacterium]|nr:bifunctional DNA-formamidopyrimidine glycosylase/DNA-(apurinic or apyrimidinic site) lyase [Pyrinomonadaceae bacterium]
MHISALTSAAGHPTLSGMPELPEVEHVVRALRRSVVRRRILATEIRLPKLVPRNAQAAFNRKLKGSRICGVRRRGKFILIDLDKPKMLSHGRAVGTRPGSGSVLIFHLRMTGKFRYLTVDEELPRYAHAIFYLDNERRLVFCDQRQFGVMKLVAYSRLAHTKGIRELAPEPFSDEFSLDYLKRVLARSQRSLKTLLLDQTKVLGLGNIYASEALFRAQINPFKIATTLAPKRVARLHQAIREVLTDAMSDGTRLRVNLEHPDGFTYGEAFEDFWHVYDREGEPCVRCGARIRRETQGGRSTYWCPRCQRR